MKCKKNYTQCNHWRFEGCSDSGEAMYVVESEVLTPNIIEAILTHALQHHYAEIAVDAYAAEYTTCPGCEQLNLQLNKERDLILNAPQFQGITYYDSF